MRPPNESLDDFINIDRVPVPKEPPPVKSLQPTGKVEVLKPLARSSELAKFKAATGRIMIRPEPVPRRKGLSWYHRSLAVSGVVAAAALLLGIFAGIYAPPEPAGSQAGLALDSQPVDMPAEQNPERSTYLSPAADPTRPSYRVSATRPVERRKPLRIRHDRAGYRPRVQAVRVPRMVVSEFVPTTLIIYIENGEVRTRIEQHPTAAHKKKV